MSPSIFNPPLLKMDSLVIDQQQRAAALLVSQQVHPNASTKGHILTATYICDGPGGYIAARRAMRPGSEPDTVEVVDWRGETIRTDEVHYDGQEEM